MMTDDDAFKVQLVTTGTDPIVVNFLDEISKSRTIILKLTAERDDLKKQLEVARCLLGETEFDNHAENGKRFKDWCSRRDTFLSTFKEK